jgi:phospholipase C
VRAPAGRIVQMRAAVASSVIKHVVVIVQENRSVDDLFQTYDTRYPGAGLDTQDYGLTTKNTKQKLVAVSFTAPYDLSHAHGKPGKNGGFVTEYNNGAMNGFNLEAPQCKTTCKGTAYGFVPMAEVLPDLELAHNFAIADHVLQPNEGPSFPGHQYLIAGQAGGFGGRYTEAENPTPGTGGCNVANATIATIDVRTPYPGQTGSPIFPCETYQSPSTVLEALDAKYPADPNWAYYTPNATSIWSAPLGVATIYNSSVERAKVMIPETGIFTAISGGTLRKVSYVIPCFTNSDHAGSLSKTGPLWVASIANAIGASPYWKSTAIVVVWDDWGGWYDHYLPPTARLPRTVGSGTGSYLDPYEYGFRVPLLVISPYVKSVGFIDHTPRDSTAIINFIATVFGERPVRGLNALTDDLTPMFDFTRKPLPYTPINVGSYSPYNCSNSKAREAQPVDQD